MQIILKKIMPEMRHQEHTRLHLARQKYNSLLCTKLVKICILETVFFVLGSIKFAYLVQKLHISINMDLVE